MFGIIISKGGLTVVILGCVATSLSLGL